MGRFLTADPYKASGGPSDPGSWNQYAYVGGDPINRYDPSGQFYEVPDPLPDPFAPGPQRGPAKPSPTDPPLPPKVDFKTNQFARSLLQKRLTGFADSDCYDVLQEGGIDPDKIINNYSSVLFFDARDTSPYSDVPLSYIVKGDTSGQTIGGSAGPRATTISGTKDVLLGGDFFGVNLNRLSSAQLAGFQLDQQNTLLHEVIHALTGLSDNNLFTNQVFLQNGLDNSDYKNFGNTGAFTDWLKNGCK
jgi:hypothetical protein